MAEVRVASWIELQDALFHESWRADIGRHRSPYAFRGASIRRGDLRTSLQRTGLERHEHHLLKHFRKYAQSSYASDSIWNWLALGKHHGLPTRMLDWTYSPYVALHFATAGRLDFDTDGVVWGVDYTAANRLLPPQVRRVLDDEESQIFTAEMLETFARSLPEFDRVGKEGDFVLFFEPPSLDERIVNQFALFSVPSRVDLDLEAFLADHPAMLRKIVFPAELKGEVRDKLDQANITERVLFPGLDGLAEWLRRYYTAR